MLEYLIGLSGVAMDTIDYSIKFTLASKNKPKEKEYPDLWKSLDGKIAFLVNLYAPDEDKLEELSYLQERENYKTYLPWVHLALNNGTKSDKAQVLEQNPRIGGVYLFGLGNDKAANLAHITQLLPESIDTVVIKDYYSKIKDFSTFLKAVYDFRESDAAALAVPIVPNNDPNWCQNRLLTRLQEHEYDLAMNLGRRALGLLGASTVSGACSAFKRKALEDLIKQNSYDWIGEDFENSVLTIGKGKKIYFDPRPQVVTTHSPSSYKRLYLQRRGWERARLKVTNDNLFTPLKGLWKDFKENNTYKTLAKGLSKENLTNRGKTVGKDAAFSYQFYIQNCLFETLGMIPKAYSIPIIGLAAANFIETNLGSNILPETIKLFPTDIEVSTSAKAFKVYATGLAAWSGLNLFHLSQSDLPHKRKRIKAAALFPVYKLGLLGPSFAGATRFTKEFYRMNIKGDKSVNRFEECAGSLPIQIRYDANKTTELSAELNRFSGDKQYFNNIFYKTDYHDIMVAKLDPAFQKAFNLPEAEYHAAANLINKELSIYTLEEFTRLLAPQLSVEDIELKPQKSITQEGWLQNKKRAVHTLYTINTQDRAQVFYSQHKRKHKFTYLGNTTPAPLEPHSFELDLLYDEDDNRFTWYKDEEEIISGDINIEEISPEPYA
ncbi:MAG: hypothetical protein ACQESG_00835 [Nanobdellota archaeon]